MREQRIALEGLHHARHPVPAPHPQVVALGDVVGEDHLGVAPHAGEHREQHIALQGLGLVDDDEGVVEGAAADMGQGQDLELAQLEDAVDALAGHHRAQRVEDGLRPGLHLLPGVPGQEAQGLAADGVQGPEDQDPLVLLAVDDGVEPGRQGQRRLAGAGAPAQRDDADLRVDQVVDADALLGRAAPHPEDLPVAAHQAQPARDDGGQRRAARGGDDDAGVLGLLGQGGRRRGVDQVGRLQALVLPQPVHLRGAHGQLRHAGVAGVHGQLGPVLLGGQPHGGRLDAHGQVLGDDDDVVAPLRQGDGRAQDPGVVVPQAHAGGQDAVVGAAQLHAQGAARVVERDRAVQAPVLPAQGVEQAQGGAGEVAQLGVVALALQLGDDDDGQDDGVLVEAQDGAGVG